MAEQQTFINLINRYLGQQAYLTDNGYLPLKQNDSLLKACGDGVLLAYYVAWCTGQMCVVKKPKNTFQKGDIINNLLKQALDGGAQFVNIGCSDLQTSYKLLLAFLTAVTKQGLRRLLAESQKKHAALLKKLGIDAVNGDDLIMKWFKMDALRTLEDIDCKTILCRLREVDCRFLSVKDCQEESFELVNQCCRQMGIEIGFSADDFQDQDMHYMICALIVQKTLTYPAINNQFLHELYNYDGHAASIVETHHFSIPQYTSKDELATNDKAAQYVLLDEGLKSLPKDSELDAWISKRTAETTFYRQWRDIMQQQGFSIGNAQEFHAALDQLKITPPFLLQDLENEMAIKECLRSVAAQCKFAIPATQLSEQCVLAISRLQSFSTAAVLSFVQSKLKRSDDVVGALHSAGLGWCTDEVLSADDQQANQVLVEQVLALDQPEIDADMKAVFELYGTQQDALAAVFGCLFGDVQKAAQQLNMSIKTPIETQFQQWANIAYYVAVSCASPAFYDSQLHLACLSFDAYYEQLPAAAKQRFDAQSTVLQPLIYERFFKTCAGDFERDLAGSDDSISLAEKLALVVTKNHVAATIKPLVSVSSDGIQREAEQLLSLASQLGIASLGNEWLRPLAIRGIVARAIVMLCTKAQECAATAPEAQNGAQQAICVENSAPESCSRGTFAFDADTREFVEQRYQAFVKLRECAGTDVRAVCAEFFNCAADKVSERLMQQSGNSAFLGDFDSDNEILLQAKVQLMKYTALYRNSTELAEVSRHLAVFETSDLLLKQVGCDSARYTSFSSDLKVIVCSELYAGALQRREAELVRQVSYLVQRCGSRPLIVKLPTFAQLVKLKKFEFPQVLSDRANAGKKLELLHYADMVCAAEYASARYAPLDGAERYINMMLGKLGIQQQFSLTNISQNAHLLLNVARRSSAVEKQLSLEATLQALQDSKYDTLLLQNENDTDAFERLAAQTLVPTAQRRVQIMDVEKKRGYNCTWQEYVVLRMKELKADVPDAENADSRIKDVIADLYFEPESELDRRHKLQRAALLGLYKLPSLAYESVCQRLCERFQFLSAKNFVESVRSNVVAADYYTEAQKSNVRVLHLLLSDITKQHVLKQQLPSHVAWLDRVSKFAAKISNIQKIEQVDYKVIGQLCGVILCQSCTYYNIQETAAMLDQIGVVKFYSLDQLANKDQFVIPQLIAELYYPYDKMRSQMVYTNRFLRNYISMRTDNDAIAYCQVKSVTGEEPAHLAAQLETGIGPDDLNTKNEVFLTMFLVDRYLSKQTPPPAHFVKYLQRHFQIQAFMLQKINASDMAKVFLRSFPKYQTELVLAGIEAELYPRLQAIAKKEGIFIVKGNDYETSYIINNIVRSRRPTDEQFEEKMGKLTDELVDKLSAKRLPPYLKRDAVLRQEGLQWVMFKDLYYQE